MGRPKGAVNMKTRSIQLFCRSVVEDPEYRKTIVERSHNGTLGAMEPVIWAYGYGKPKESVDVRVGLIEDLSVLSVEELTQRAAKLLTELKEAEELQCAIDAEYAQLPAQTGVDNREVAKNSAQLCDNVVPNPESLADSGVDNPVHAETRAELSVNDHEDAAIRTEDGLHVSVDPQNTADSMRLRESKVDENLVRQLRDSPASRHRN